MLGPAYDADKTARSHLSSACMSSKDKAAGLTEGNVGGVENLTDILACVYRPSSVCASKLHGQQPGGQDQLRPQSRCAHLLGRLLNAAGIQVDWRCCRQIHSLHRLE